MTLEQIIEQTIEDTVKFERSGVKEVIGFIPNVFLKYISNIAHDKTLMDIAFNELKKQHHLSIHKRWDLYESLYEVYTTNTDVFADLNDELIIAISENMNQ